MPRPRIEFVQSQFLPWQTAPVAAARPGAEARVLSRDPDTGALSLLVRYPAGWAREGEEWLPADEEFLVLQGGAGDRRPPLRPAPLCPSAGAAAPPADGGAGRRAGADLLLRRAGPPGRPAAGAARPGRARCCSSTASPSPIPAGSIRSSRRGPGARCSTTTPSPATRAGCWARCRCAGPNGRSGIRWSRRCS